MGKVFLVAVSFLIAQVSFADLTSTESQDLTNCAQQFGMVKDSEIGENTALNEISNKQVDGAAVRVYELIQDGKSRGFLQIDVQGDINEIDQAGNFLKVCQ